MKSLLSIPFNQDRVYGLDIVRALAILFVMISHSSYIAPFDAYKYYEWITHDGVSIFFVLSGFLIGRIFINLLQKEELTLSTIKQFWIRRWFRTLPNFYLILVTLIALNILTNADWSIEAYAPYFLFVQNLFYPHPGFFPEAWSLSIEEWFYLSIPIITYLLIKVFKLPKVSAIQVLIGAIIIAVTAFRIYRFYQFDDIDSNLWDGMFRKQVVTRIDSLMYGVLGAYVFIYHNKFWENHRIKFFILGILIFALMKLELILPKNNGLYISVFSFSAASIATLLILPFMNSLKTGKGLIYNALTKISLISYSLYLVHFTLIEGWLINLINWETIARFNYTLFLYSRYTLFWLASIILSILIYKYFEVPTTKLRDRY